MQILQLQLVTLFLLIGACSAQTKAPQVSKTQTTTKSKPSKTKPSAVKAEKPKETEKPSQTGTKLHPEQERAYSHAYTTGAVRKP